MLGAIKSGRSRCCMQLLCTSLFSKRFLKFLHGTVVPKLPCRTISQAFVWNCCSKLALQSYFLSPCMEPSCRSCLAKLLLKLSRGTVAQRPPCAISYAFAWGCRAKHAFRSCYSGSRVTLSCMSCLLKLLLELSYGAAVQKLLLRSFF